MIVGLGIDLVEVARIDEAMARARFDERCFTEREQVECNASSNPIESRAARFAAKEAYFKAIGTGWGTGGDWTEIEVRRGEKGAPSLHLTGRAKELADERGVVSIHLSMTHTSSSAAAVVILESA